MSNKVRVYVATVVVSASLGLAALVAAGDDNGLRSAQAAACFACLGVFAQFLSYRVEAKKAIPVVAIPFLATIYLAPTWVSLVAFGGVAVVGAAINRRPTVKNVFNVAKGVLTGALAIAVYRAHLAVRLASAVRFQLGGVRRRLCDVPFGEQPSCHDGGPSSRRRGGGRSMAQMAGNLTC